MCVCEWVSACIAKDKTEFYFSSSSNKHYTVIDDDHRIVVIFSLIEWVFVHWIFSLRYFGNIHCLVWWVWEQERKTELVLRYFYYVFWKWACECVSANRFHSLHKNVCTSHKVFVCILFISCCPRQPPFFYPIIYILFVCVSVFAYIHGIVSNVFQFSFGGWIRAFRIDKIFLGLDGTKLDSLLHTFNTNTNSIRNSWFSVWISSKNCIIIVAAFIYFFLLCSPSKLLYIYSQSWIYFVHGYCSFACIRTIWTIQPNNWIEHWMRRN